MDQNFCALCSLELIEETNSKEHILPNSIGGRKTVKNFICIDCNNKTGTEWDSILFEQLAPFCTMFGIKKQRGEVPPLNIKTLDGQEYKQFNNGVFQPLRPKFSREKLSNGTIKFHYTGGSIAEVKKFLKGMDKKYKFSEEEIKEFNKQLVLKKSYLTSPVAHELNFGGEKSGRSIVKTCLALATCLGLNALDCEKGINYLVGDSEPCFGYYYEKDLLKKRKLGQPFHCVYIKAINSSKQILGYIEYFGFQRIVLCLSTEYEGDDKEIMYAIDPMSGEEIKLDIDLHFTDIEINQIYNYEKYDIENLKVALGLILDAAVKFSKKRALELL